MNHVLVGAPDPPGENEFHWGAPLWCGLSSKFFDHLFIKCVSVVGTSYVGTSCDVSCVASCLGRSPACSTGSAVLRYCADTRDTRHHSGFPTVCRAPRWSGIGVHAGCSCMLTNAQTNRFVFSFLRQLTTWHCSHLLMNAVLPRRPTTAAIDGYLLPAEPTAANPSQRHVAVDRWDRQTKRQTDGHRTVT